MHAIANYVAPPAAVDCGGFDRAPTRGRRAGWSLEHAMRAGVLIAVNALHVAVR